MGRRELREQIFLLLFRVEFNNPEEMPAQLKMFLKREAMMKICIPSAKRTGSTSPKIQSHHGVLTGH